MESFLISFFMPLFKWCMDRESSIKSTLLSFYKHSIQMLVWCHRWTTECLLSLSLPHSSNPKNFAIKKNQSQWNLKHLCKLIHRNWNSSNEFESGIVFDSDRLLKFHLASSLCALMRALDTCKVARNYNSGERAAWNSPHLIIIDIKLLLPRFKRVLCKAAQ